VQSLLLLSCTGAGKIDLTYNKPAGMGNTMGNLLNFGIVANDSSSIYYTTFTDTQVILAKKSIITGEAQVVKELGFNMNSYINVVGDFIYYIDSADDAIYKMDINGEQNEKLCDIKARFLLVVNDTVYALGGESDSFDGNLYVMNTNGSGIITLTSDDVSDMYYYNDEIYYTTYIDQKQLLYKIDLEGKNKELIAPDVDLGIWFYIYKEKIYYKAYLGEFIYGFRMIDINSGEDSLVYEHMTSDMIPDGFINAAGNILYFRTLGAPPTYTYLNLDTGEAKTSWFYVPAKLGFYTIGNKVFYYKDYQPYTMNFDGTGRKRFY
jgi:hypothetical protein